MKKLLLIVCGVLFSVSAAAQSCSPASSILGLLNPCGPAAISRLIIAVIVDAVEGQSLGPSPHVGNEIVETCAPTITDLDAASTVLFIVKSSWAVATIQHRPPNRIFRPPSRISCSTMTQSGQAGTRIFSLNAATSTSQPSEQALLQDGLFVATRTAAEPFGPLFTCNQSQHSEASECSAG